MPRSEILVNLEILVRLVIPAGLAVYSSTAVSSGSQGSRGSHPQLTVAGAVAWKSETVPTEYHPYSQRVVVVDDPPEGSQLFYCGLPDHVQDS